METPRSLTSAWQIVAPVQSRLTTVALIAAPLAVLFIWVTLLSGGDTNLISDFGLITAIPTAAFIALFILNVSFVFALGQHKPLVPILLLHVVVLIVCLYGAAMLVEGLPRTAVAWKLSGIMDLVMQHGAVDASRDAFQNWPGFFILVAFLTSLSGIGSPLVLAAWAHVINSFLYLGPLLLLYRTATEDRRLMWLAVWFFYLCNWIGQDYLAPQAFGYLYYLVILGVLLTWFRGGSGIWETIAGWQKFVPYRMKGIHARLARIGNQWFAPDKPGPQSSAVRHRQVGLVILVVTCMVAITPSHQLSPVALLAAIGALVVLGRISPRGLPIILGVLVVAFVSYATVPYLRGHIQKFIEPLGSITSNVSANVTDRVRGSLEHLIVVRSRMGASVVIWLIAGAGLIRRMRFGYRDTNFALLAAIPFGLLGVQKYGGELLLRTFLFSIPFVAYFMAALFWPRIEQRLSWRLGICLAAVCAGLSVSFFLTRYGNERMDYFTPDEVSAVEYLYSQAEPGAQIVAGTSTLPWRYKEYNEYRYTTVERAVRTNDLDILTEVMSDQRYSRSYFILTRSEQAAAELYLGWETGVWERFERSLLHSPRFELIYSNADAKIFVLTARHSNP